mgnify:CR=1 FL=1
MMKFEKFNFTNLEKIEKKLVFWIFRKRHRIVLFIFFLLLLFTAYYIPYLNLFINSYLILSVLLLLALFILDIDSKPFFIIGLTLFFLTFVLWSVNQIEEAETLAEYIYLILLSGSIKALFSS